MTQSVINPPTPTHSHLPRQSLDLPLPRLRERSAISPQSSLGKLVSFLPLLHVVSNLWQLQQWSCSLPSRQKKREKGAPMEVLNDSLDVIHLLLTHQLFCDVHDEEPTFPAAAAEKGLQANNEPFFRLTVFDTAPLHLPLVAGCSTRSKRSHALDRCSPLPVIAGCFSLVVD